MRDMIIVRGPQGSGKSSFICGDCGLAGHHLSFDKVREVVSGDWMSPDGRMGVSQQHNQLVRAMAFESLRRRMEMGETIAFEATLPKTRDVRALTDLAAANGYRVMVVDFFGMPADIVHQANADRPERVRVSDFAVDRCYDESAGSTVADGIEVVRIGSYDDRMDAAARVSAFLRDGRGRIDLSAFDRVVHVGDLQSTHGPLTDPASPLHGGLRDDTAYVFCGDLFDRGVESAAVARFWLDTCHARDNVWLVGGNHESWLEAQARGGPVSSREWRERTWPALEAAGFTEADMAAIATDVVPYVRYGWRGTEVLVSHGGFPVMPDQLHLLPEHVLRRGAGEYGRQVDARWDEAQMALPEGERVHGVHGHRNQRMLPVMASANGWSVNLEGGVEFGGHMRFAVLDGEGWHPIEIRSKEFRTMVEAREIDMAAGRKGHGDEAPMTPWAKRGELGLRPLSDETLAAFQNHGMIGESVSETRPTVSSWNFTKSAFYTQTFDAWTSVARGLFVDNVDNTVISRGRDKFFNLGERPETQMDHVLANIEGPVNFFDKINGFFSTVGYSERLGELIVTSKSRIEGTFPDMANDMIDAKLGAGGRERMLRFCRDQKACLMFEVVDMARDPHIIDYPEDRLVLLACIRRDEVFEEVPYDTLLAIGAWLGCDVKQNLFPGITHPKAIERILRQVTEDVNWRAGDPTEGVVVEAANMCFKGKGRYYAVWKRARGAVERIAMTRRKDVEFDRSRYDDTPEIAEFLDWAQTLPTEAFALDIISLRNAWTGGDATRAVVEAMGEAPKPKARDMSGYIRAVEGMAANVAAGRAKPESVRKMLDAGMADDDKRGVLETSPAGETLRSFLLQAA